MMLRPVMLAILLLVAPGAAAAADRDTASQADLSCLAVVLSLAGVVGREEEVDATSVAGLAGSAMYYLGRLEARDPETAWLDELMVYIEDVDEAEFKGQFDRCGAEMLATGQRMTAWGEAMRLKSKTSDGKP